jgi:hypothetical protein
MSTIKIPDILLPKNADWYAWAVNACDQFTSDHKYWQEVESLTEGKPSTFNLIYPEIYLKQDTDNRIKNINSNMKEYLSKGIFEEVTGGFILVERTTQSGTRTGIVLAVDLEDYSYEKGTKALIRSTEATILERIPPRVKIRQNAPIELPHVMLLYDDKNNDVLNKVKRGKVLYDFDMNMNGGHIKGTYIQNAQEIISAFENLTDEKTCLKKYGSSERLMFAVGDGNHSLATAKTCWNNIKANLTDEQKANHPARFALVEVVNIYDPALNFEPIHRLVKTDKAEKFIKNLNLSGKATATVVTEKTEKTISFPEDTPQGIRQLDEYISNFIKENGGEVDYIHGDDEVKSFADQGVAIILPAISKDDFFRLIISGGNLPRKTFSMGEGNEKRYYIEAKRIV